MGLVVEYIEVAAFGSYLTKQRLILGGQGPVALVGDNGTGKSTIASKALAWALYGKTAPERMGSGTGTIRGRHVRALAAKKGQPTRVTVSLLAGDERWVVMRERAGFKGGDKLVITADGEELDPSQSKIDALIGADYDVFVRTCLRGQADPWNWAEATDAKKREILDAISGAGALEVPYERARKIARERRNIAQTYEQRCADLDRRRDAIDPTEERRKAELWDDDRGRRLQDAEQELSALEGALRSARAADEEADAIRARRAAKEAAAPTLDIQPYQDAWQRSRVAYNEAESAAIRLQVAWEAVADLEPGKTCPTCRQRIGPDAPIAKARDDLAPKVHDATAQQHETHKAMTAATEALEQAQTWLQQAREAHQRELQALVVPDGAVVGAREQAVQQARRRAEEVRSATNPWWAAVEQAEAAKTELERDAATLREAHRLAVQAAGLADAWVEVLHPRGVRAQLADAALVAIESEANRWLAALSSGRMSISFDAGKGERLGTTVRMDGEGRDLITYSGGEKRRVNLAVDMGIAAVFARGGALALSLLVLDEEVLSGVDEAGKQAIVRALHTAGVADVVVIDHDTRLTGALPRTVVVTETPNGSVLEEL